MSMHSQSEGSFDRINKSMTGEKDTSSEEEKLSRKRCIIITLTILGLVAAITALVLVIVLQGGGSGIPKGHNGYTVEKEVDGKWYYQALLHRTKNLTFVVEPDDEKNPEFDDLKMRASMMNDHTVRFKINPIKVAKNGGEEAKDIKRWEVPQEMLGNTKDDYGMRLIWANMKTMKNPAGIELSNPETGQLYLSTKNRNLAFMEKYIEQGFEIDSRHIYGFGERQKTFELNTGEYSSWANGRDNHYDGGKLGGHSYGDHPFVLARLNDNTFVGIFFANSNAKTLEYSHVGKNKSILNFRAIGGILDFYTFFAESPEDVIKAYHGVIGVSYLPPFWSLGFHQSSWQYGTQKEVEKVSTTFDMNKIPLEGMWLDIEYMDGYKNFLVDKSRFTNLKSMATTLHKKGQKLIPIVDAGFKADDKYIYYETGTAHDLFIKTAEYPREFDGNLIGSVWPGKSAFLDFLNPGTTTFWVNGLTGLHTLSTFDGIWIDMNEITSMCENLKGECPIDHPEPEQERRNLKESEWSPTGDISIIDYSISLDAKHYAETEEDKALNVEYNLHSLYGAYEAKATYEYWLKGTKLQGKRPFILSRSTFAGSGKWTSHWLGDNYASWEFMQFSIAGILDFNMFGIPVVGADVCGFHSNTTDELCGRWHQLSAFYPFARNHNNLTDKGEPLRPQEAYSLKEPYNAMAKHAIIQRYSYLRYMYTRLYEINQNGGGTLARPLFFEFPEDDNAYQGYEHTFMIGSALKISPVLRPESEHNGKIRSYFPAGSRFISLVDFKNIVIGGEKGKNETLDALQDFTHVHLREGTILPFQNMTKDNYEMRTEDLIAKQGITLVIFADENNTADGTLYIDENGDDFTDIELNHFQYYKLRFNSNTLSIEKQEGDMSQGSTSKGNQLLSKIVILNAEKYKSVTPTSCAFDLDFVPREVNVEYDEFLNALVITGDPINPFLFKNLMAIQFSDTTDNKTFCNAKYTVKGVTRHYESENDDITVRVTLDIGSETTTLLPDLKAEFSLVDDEVLRIQINAPSETEFSAPIEALNSDFVNGASRATIDIFTILNIPKEGEDFYYEIHEMNDPKKVYYSTKGQNFVYSKYYKKTTALIESTGNIFGLGERVGDFFLDEGVYTIWNRDEPSPIEDGMRPGNNIYGTHPVYFTHTSDNNHFFAVFDHNVGAQDYIIKKESKKYAITQIKTSGKTDQFIILRSNFQRVLAKFQDVVGKPAMVPEWGLGWHQCRYGYNNTAQVNEVVEKFREYQIPLDVIWTDIDYMEQYRDFTLSNSDFKDLAEFVSNWNSTYNLKYIPILDGGIAYRPGEKDSAYERGKKFFIKDANNPKKPFIGKVWPGPAVFIDWLNEKAEKYWIGEMKKLYDKLPFDGMWIDMNEASNFCNGYCTKDQIVKDSIEKKLFYTPGARDLNAKSISIDALHEGGVTEFEAHSTYGFYMSKATSNYFTKEKGTRQFIITRSTYSGVGKYASHWLGDNFSTFEMLKASISGIYLFQMYGVPIAGADICGFIDDTNANL